MPVPLDDLTAHLDTGRESLEGGQRHRAARYVLAPPPERLVQFGRIDAVQSDHLPCDNDGIAVDDLGAAGQAIGTSAESQNGD